MNPRDLYEWCKIPAGELASHPRRRIPFRLVKDSAEMGRVMACELLDVVRGHNASGLATRAILPCGPVSWLKPFRDEVNALSISLRNLHVFHMDECLDWQGRLLPQRHPYNFHSFMEENFYAGIRSELAVPHEQRHWLTPETAPQISRRLTEAPVDIALGGWGQDGHVAYNQARRHPFSAVTIEDLAESTIRIQENNLDTILALAQRTFGGAYQFVPPMSITLGMSQCMAARRVRLFSDTGAWKQTALRVALFSEPVAEYPITLLQTHADALLTATLETARHPVSENPQWQLF